MAVKNTTPVRKRYKQKQRLEKAATWIRNYKGKNIIKGYGKHFGVDKPCSIKELGMCGVMISEERKKQVIDAHNRIIEERRKRKELKENAETDFTDSDAEFAFIAGYTSGGAPYGIRWDEQDTFIDWEEQDDVLPW